ncbi:hypothetical protein Sjap_000158 [Stephania japonica]|uniref:Uncharacterized protein n=1 Tax=Stephania japonica TaxID=461633 RepID=A0AAP0PQ50_9MAGN
MLFVAKEEEISRDLHEMMEEGLVPKKDDSENSELDPNKEDSKTSQLDAKEDSKTSQLDANEDSNHTTTTLNKNEVPAKKIMFVEAIYSALHWLVSILFFFVGGFISTKISFFAASGKKLQAECQQVLINSLFCFLALSFILGSRMTPLQKMFLTAYAFGALYAVMTHLEVGILFFILK